MDSNENIVEAMSSWVLTLKRMYRMKTSDRQRPAFWTTYAGMLQLAKMHAPAMRSEYDSNLAGSNPARRAVALMARLSSLTS